MRLVPSLEQVSAASANVWDSVVGPGLADLRPQPAAIIDEGRQRTVFRYLARDRGDLRGDPVLLVPPLAAPATCFDLRRGCSVAEHLLAAGHPTYLVDYGSIAFGDRNLGVEHWIDEVVPRSIEAVSRDAAGAPVQLVGW